MKVEVEMRATTYQSREYMRYEQSGASYDIQRSQPSRSLWVKKTDQKEHNPLHIERSESSKPITQPHQLSRVSTMPVEMPVEAINQARDEIRD